MQALVYAAFVLLAFGLGARYALGAAGAFPALHLAGAGICLSAALALAAKRVSIASGGAARRALLRATARTFAIATAAVAGVGLASRSGLRWDWSREQRFELAEATLSACRAVPGARATLFGEAGDPRLPHTRALLAALAERCALDVSQREVSEAGGPFESFEELRSNSVGFAYRDRIELVERPHEGAIFEALTHLAAPERGELGWLAGAGGGDLASTAARGFSGLAAALATEGYALRELPVATLSEVPAELGAVLALAPERALPEDAISALGAYLERGGRLMALLEPGRASGVEALLARYGLSSPDRTLIDPDARTAFGLAPGLALAATRYESHPATTGLGRNRSTFFAGARSFALQKPEPGDRVGELVWSDGDTWLAAGAKAPSDAFPQPEDAAGGAYHPVAVAGRYARAGGETRIVAFGDSEFASNRFLRAVYNLDLVMNGVHWLVRQEPAITLRPKLPTAVQFPLPLADTLTTFYGVGLLLPELLLLAGGVVWLARRSA
jgi:hypothetical protein